MQNCSDRYKFPFSWQEFPMCHRPENKGAMLCQFFLQLSEEKFVHVVSKIPTSRGPFHVIHVLWENVVYIMQGFADFFKYLGATYKFYIPEGCHDAGSILRTHSSAVTCEPTFVHMN
jgi:hypothetical protein